MNKNWSAALEHGDYSENITLVVKDALDAVKQTAAGYYVNLVTPSDFGHPDTYLTDILHDLFKNEIRVRFIDQCGCGGYVLRVWKKEKRLA